MSSTSSEHRRAPRAGCAVLGLAALTGCTFLPASLHVRAPLTLPPAISARYAIPGEVEEQVLVPIGGGTGVRYFRGELLAGDERAEFHYLVPDGTEPRPFVLCLPILAGGQALMWIIAESMAERGYAVAWTRRVASALKPPQRGAEIEQLFRRTVIHNRMLLAWARRQPEIDPDRTGCLGVSTGGIVGGVLLAVEPELAGGALCLAGGDLPDLLLVSSEDRIAKWREWRAREDGLSGSELRRELERELHSDPALLGPYVPSEKVLLVGCALDTVVPSRHQDVLWESLGRPERRILPLGHYTSALGFGTILGSVDEFLGRRMSDRSRLAAPR